jgi:hypothetical protein
MTRTTKQEAAESRAALLNRDTFGITHTGTLYTILRHRSRSGMARVISVVVIRNGTPLDISHHVARVCGFGFDRDRFGVKVRGCGMDMGFHVVDTLFHAMFGDGEFRGGSFRHNWL